MVQIKQEEEIY
jgi:hypothetical protein